MNDRCKALISALLALLGGSVLAQNLQLTASPALTTAALQTQADFIVAVVNSEPITRNDVQREVQRVLMQLAQQQRSAPQANVLAAELLERLINVKAQLQFAHESGLRVDESAIDQAEKNVALQNHFSVAELRDNVVREGVPFSRFRAELRDQITLQRLRERDVETRIRVSEQEIDAYIREQQGKPNAHDWGLNLAQILLTVPEGSTPEQVAAIRARAQQVLTRARSGADFAALVTEFSDVTDKSNGGEMGFRTVDRYPVAFVQASQSLALGAIADLLQTPAGFHVLKVVEKSIPGVAASLTQSHARHILLLQGKADGELELRQKLAAFRQRVVAGQADFAELARDYSQDGSAKQGGDLGWANAGTFVSEFEEVMNQLAPGEISQPLQSRFGWHLIQLLERRQVTISPQQQREAVRNLLREKKMDEAYRLWAQDIRAKAYVEMRDAPS